MNLEKYQRKNKRISSVRKISIGKGGRIGFSALLEKEAGLKNGGKVDFYEDKKHPGEWYFSLAEKGDFLLRKTTASVGVYCKDLAENIIISSGNTFYGKKPLYFLVGVPTEIEGVKYWPILFEKNK
jgi:hypothetical protein